MRVETLLSPGLLSMGLRLRTEAAKAISAAEIQSAHTPGGKSSTAATLSAFFTDCASKLSTLVDTTAPTVTGRAATSATQITIAFSESMDQTVLPAKSAFAVAQGSAGGAPGAITSVAWVDATHLKLVGTAFAAGNTVTYTKPASNTVRDLAGNDAASFTGATA